ncbi:protein adenylyltransferase FICD [Hyalella azteca]|uniref:Protein adenylyltransferase Fic n=1 Tax=Hyalella azteca TaxID=294128 RepID=A0A979FYK1_HYAAZ|nr:protein adenylyltransferase FICD [Hyalella azteca]
MNWQTFILIFTAELISGLMLLLLKNYLGGLSSSLSIFDINFNKEVSSFPKHFNFLLDEDYQSLVTREPPELNRALAKKESSDLEQKNDLNEAESCIRASERLIQVGRYEKAGKLLERAVALAPTLPQALLALGEHLERQEGDLVRADLFYVRALMLAPDNPRAISVLYHHLSVLYHHLSAVPSPQCCTITSVCCTITSVLYHHLSVLYHHLSDALTGLSVAGKGVAEHTEVLGVASALRYINSSLLHRVGAITLQDILDIHLRVLGHTDPPAAGHLRTSQVFVGPHLPPAPPRLEELMHQFVSWLNDPASLALHPVRYAALAHYQLVYIHPFVDGNGRTARLLMNFLLMQAGYPAIIIRHQDRLEYYDTLQAANEGDTRPFVRFIAHCTEKTLDVYLWATRDASRAIDQDPKPAIRPVKALPGSSRLPDDLQDRWKMPYSPPDVSHDDIQDRRKMATSSMDVSQDDGFLDADEEEVELMLLDELTEKQRLFEDSEHLFERNKPLIGHAGADHDPAAGEGRVNKVVAQPALVEAHNELQYKPSDIASRHNIDSNIDKKSLKPWKVSLEDPLLIENARLDHAGHLFVQQDRQDAAPHRWLSGQDLSGSDYQRSSRYYSRHYLRPDVIHGEHGTPRGL